MTAVASYLTGSSISTHMPRYSIPVSEFGSLALCETDMVVTRSQARRAAGPHRVEHTSRAPDTPPSSATRRRQPSRFPAHPYGRMVDHRDASDDSEEENDDDEEADSDEEEEEEEEEEGEDESDRRPTQIRALDILSVFAPEGLFINEAFQTSHNADGPQNSAMFCNVMRHVVRYIETEHELGLLKRQLSIEHPFWQERTVNRIQNEAHRFWQEYTLGTPNRDAIYTLTQLQRVLRACRYVLRFYSRELNEEARVRLVDLPIRILQYIVAAGDGDVRENASTPRTYAGGSLRHEYNIYRRLVTNRESWEEFMSCFENIAQAPGARELFQRQKVVLRGIFIAVDQKHEDAIPEETEGQFKERLRIVFARVGVFH